jgi:predicted peptidase
MGTFLFAIRFNRKRNVPVFLKLLGALWILGGSLPFADADRLAKQSPGVHFGTLDHTNRKYALLIPSDYNEQGERRWPLIVALHYSTGSGADYLASWQEEAERRKYVVFAPDSSDLRVWSTDDAPAIIDQLKDLLDAYRIDRKRVLLAGMSAGAHFTYYLASRYPSFFRAVVPIAGSYDRFARAITFSSSLKSVRFCIVHGEKDQRVPVEEAKKSADVLRSHGIRVTVLTFPSDDHYSIYRNREILDWFESLT